jgi:signal peptidase II
VGLLVAALGAVVVVVIDQASKAVVIDRPGVQRNASFRISSPAATVVFAALVAVTILLVMLPLPLPTAAGLGLTVGGVAGNLRDRQRRGAVIDFVRIGPWPAFNVADVGLVAGLVLVLVGML